MNHSTPSNLADIFDDFATPSPILLIICKYYATCFETGFLGPQDEAIYDVTVFVRLPDSS